MLLSLRGSLTGLADPLIRLAPFWVLFPLRGSIFETALHWVWLTRDLCFSVILARFAQLLFSVHGSLRVCACLFTRLALFLCSSNKVAQFGINAFRSS